MTDTKDHTPARRSLEGRVFRPSSPAETAEAVELAFDYRGDVTLEHKSSTTLTGYVFNQPCCCRSLDRSPPSGEPHPRRIACRDIMSIEFTGVNTNGKSWETWVSKKPFRPTGESAQSKADARIRSHLPSTEMPVPSEHDFSRFSSFLRTNPGASHCFRRASGRALSLTTRRPMLETSASKLEAWRGEAFCCLKPLRERQNAFQFEGCGARTEKAEVAAVVVCLAAAFPSVGLATLKPIIVSPSGFVCGSDGKAISDTGVLVKDTKISYGQVVKTPWRRVLQGDVPSAQRKSRRCAPG